MLSKILRLVAVACLATVAVLAGSTSVDGHRLSFSQVHRVEVNGTDPTRYVTVLDKSQLHQRSLLAAVKDGNAPVHAPSNNGGAPAAAPATRSGAGDAEEKVGEEVDDLEEKADFVVDPTPPEEDPNCNENYCKVGWYHKLPFAKDDKGPSPLCERYQMQLKNGAPVPVIIIDISTAELFTKSIQKSRAWLQDPNNRYVNKKAKTNPPPWQYKTKYRTMRLQWGPNKFVDILMGHNIYMTGFISRQYKLCAPAPGGYGLFGLSEFLVSYKGEVVVDGKPSVDKGAAGPKGAEVPKKQPEVIRWSTTKLILTLENIRANDATFMGHLAEINKLGDKYWGDLEELEKLKKKKPADAKSKKSIQDLNQSLKTQKPSIVEKARQSGVLDLQLMFPLAEAIRFAFWEKQVHDNWGKEILAPKDLLFLGQWATNSNEVGIPIDKANTKIGEAMLASRRSSSKNSNQKKAAASDTTQNNNGGTNQNKNNANKNTNASANQNTNAGANNNKSNANQNTNNANANQKNSNANQKKDNAGTNTNQKPAAK